MHQYVWKTMMTYIVRHSMFADSVSGHERQNAWWLNALLIQERWVKEAPGTNFTVLRRSWWPRFDESERRDNDRPDQATFDAEKGRTPIGRQFVAPFRSTAPKTYKFATHSFQHSTNCSRNAFHSVLFVTRATWQKMKKTHHNRYHYGINLMLMLFNQGPYRKARSSWLVRIYRIYVVELQ